MSIAEKFKKRQGIVEGDSTQELTETPITISKGRAFLKDAILKTIFKGMKAVHLSFDADSMEILLEGVSKASGKAYPIDSRKIETGKVKASYASITLTTFCKMNGLQTTGSYPVTILGEDEEANTIHIRLGAFVPQKSS